MVDLLPGSSKLNTLRLAIKGLNYRVIGTGIRFTVPLFIIAVSSENELGVYYLSLSILLTASSFLGLEMGYFFSTKYLSKNTSSKKNVLNILITKCIWIPFLISILIVTFYVFGAGVNIPLFVFLLPILFSLEACSYEIGRFFWNIGEIDQASYRDFIKSIFFIIAIYTSLIVTDSVLSAYSIIILILSNICIIFYEVRKWGNLNDLRKNFFILKKDWLSKSVTFLKTLLNACGPQFVQNQVIGLTMLFEKIFITSLLGLSTQGVFSFVYSIMQTSAALFLMPSAAKTKQIIISDHPHFNNPKIYSAAINYLPIVVFFMIIFAIASYFAIPVLADIMDKDIDKGIFIIIVTVLFSASSNAFLSSVAPLYSHPGRWIKANIISLLMLLPLLLVAIFYNYINLDVVILSYSAIIISAVGQVAVRCIFFIMSIKRLK